MKTSTHSQPSLLIGKTFDKVEKTSTKGDDVITFSNESEEFKFWHDQDCCEGVAIHEIKGELSDLQGSPIMSLVETNPDMPGAHEFNESFTWTLFVISTEKGTVEILWYGASNGYYSERVDFSKTR